MAKANVLQEIVLDNKLERQAKAKETRGNVVFKYFSETKSYTSLEITNAVEEVLVANGYCKTDSYEMNSFLMDVLEKVGHYK